MVASVGKESIYLLLSGRNEVLAWAEGERRQANVDGEGSCGLGGPVRETGGGIGRATGGEKEGKVSTAGDVDESGAGINNGGGGAAYGNTAVADTCDADAPVPVNRGRLCSD